MNGVDLYHAPLKGRATVLWRDGSAAECSNLADVVEVGLPAVVSLTEWKDIDCFEELLDLALVALRFPLVEYLVVTSKWICVGGSSIKPLRKLAAMPNVSLGLICSHDTGLMPVKNVILCWDYNCGTPRVAPPEDVKSRSNCYISPGGWKAWAKVSRAVHPDEVWHEFY